MKRLPYAFLFLITALTGCATYEECFDCPPGRGVGCVSITAVNAKVNRGELPLNQEEREEKEAISSLWIAPYRDGEGVLHGEQRVTWEKP